MDSQKRLFLLRRQLLTATGACLIFPVLSPALAAGVGLIGVRVWPAAEYTRVTLEFDATLVYRYQSISQPYRLFVDLEGVELTPVLESLASRIDPDDPYIQRVRIGRYNRNTIRLVMDLKTEVKPQVFELPPVGQYGHRIVIDVYPAVPRDPLLALWERVGADPQTSAGLKSNDASKNTDKLPVEKTGSGAARLLTLTLDPGHGGEDPGAIGRSGSMEKNVVLAIAQKVKRRIDAKPGMRCVLTRDGDYFIPLGGRVQKARAIKADLFVSIHADAFIKPTARGSSVFALSDGGATSAAARWLAKKENEADVIGGVNTAIADPYLARTLFDLTQTATLKDSLRLAQLVLSALGEVHTLHRNEVEQAGFAVLKAPDIPSILVETAFISNPEEEAKLNDAHYQERYADAITSGILAYLKKAVLQKG